MYWTIEMTVTLAATKGLLETEESRRVASAPRNIPDWAKEPVDQSADALDPLDGGVNAMTNPTRGRVTQIDWPTFMVRLTERGELLLRDDCGNEGGRDCDRSTRIQTRRRKNSCSTI